MKTFTLTMKIPEGNDEWWEGISGMSAKQAKEELKYSLQPNLEEHGWYDI